MIKAGKRVVAMVAPATEGQFGADITMASWRTALKKVGFAEMCIRDRVQVLSPAWKIP